MGQPAATQGSRGHGVDTHIVMVPVAGRPVPTPLPHPFNGQVDGGTVATVKIAGQPAAVVGSTADEPPAHLPTPPGTRSRARPSNQGTVQMGSATVMIGGKPAARNGDPVRPATTRRGAEGQMIAAGTVLIG